jgi:DNA helicase IV
LIAEREDEVARWIAEEVERVQEQSEAVTACAVVRSPIAARRLAAALTGLVPRRLVLDGDFRPHRGVDVTTVDQVKGLEFDHVIVADAGAHAFPDEPAARRALYVAITRARKSLSFTAIGAPSPLLVRR